MKKYIPIIFIITILALLPQISQRFYIYITAIIMLTGLLTTSLNLAIGFGGIYQFHHSVFYGVGAYATALTITKSGLPIWVAFVLAPVSSALLSLFMGLICIRLSKLYFGMLQISLGSLVWAIIYRWYSFTGGDDGIHGIELPELLSSPKGTYYFTFLVFLVGIFLMYRIVRSPFGKTLQGIRDNPARALAIGVDVRLHKLVTLVLSGFFAGIAGSLFVVVDSSVFPDMMFWTYSLEILIMCLLGGLYSFFGPLVGTTIIVLLRVFVSTYTQYWSMVLGIILTLVIIFIPDGVVGFISKKIKKAKNDA